MTDYCLFCLRSKDQGLSDYHSKCAKALFGQAAIPRLAFDPNNFHLLGLEMAGKVTVSGVQKKLALIKSDKATLRVHAEHMREGIAYILKPDTGHYPDLPANEQLCSRLAQLAGIMTPESGLVKLADQSLAFLSRRFDRHSNGKKIAVEDFCQLAEKLPREKYMGSAELCAKVLANFSSQPAVDGLHLFRIWIFSWWIGNGDLHLKNLSMVRSGGRCCLAPAYDLVSTGIVIPGDPMALPLAGKKSNFTAADWLEFARRCRIPMEVVSRELWNMVRSASEGLALISNAPMSLDLILALAKMYTERASVLGSIAVEAFEQSTRRNKALRGPVEPVGDDLIMCATKLREALRHLELPKDELPFKREMEELQWAGQGAGPLFRAEGPVAEDKDRLIQAFRTYLRLKGVADFLWEAGHYDARKQGTAKHMKEAILNPGWVTEQSGDRLFELEVASALHQSFPGQISVHVQDGRPDIVFLQQGGSDFAIECKRPGNLGSVLRLARKGVSQVGGMPGIVALSFDKILKGGWVQGQSFAECTRVAQNELDQLINAEQTENLMALLPASLDENAALPERAIGFVLVALYGCSWKPNGGDEWAVRYHLATKTIAHGGVLFELIETFLVGALRAGFNRAHR